MNENCTQTMRYRQALINYANKHGVTKAAIRYKTNRQYSYRWIKRYDWNCQECAVGISPKFLSHRLSAHSFGVKRSGMQKKEPGGIPFAIKSFNPISFG